nr:MULTISPECIES: winged helix-turn-helix domain-containing protein [unclassified Ciceribacter]
MELRRDDGALVRLRPKAFELLKLLASNSHRILTKDEILAAVWKDIHVGEDSLFQCIREIRIALEDTDRQIVKVVSGRGYLFAANVSAGRPDETAFRAPTRAVRLPKAWAAALLAAIAGLPVAWFALPLPSLLPDLFPAPRPALMILPIAAPADDSTSETLASGIASELLSGLSTIRSVDLVSADTAREVGPATHEVRLDLHRNGENWHLQAQVISVEGRQVDTVVDTISDASDGDGRQLRARLAAGVGYALAKRFDAWDEAEGRRRSGATASDLAIVQAIASINQTTRERFTTAVAILTKQLSADPDNVDLKIALAALQLRGLQLNWYDTEAGAEAERDARALLEQALRERPQSMAVLGAYCRLLTVTNEFADSLVACAQALAVNPWDGAALYNLGLTQTQLGRFDDALSTFLKAELFDTPDEARWTWLLGAGLANLLLDRNEEALDYLNRSIAITPGSGRSYLLVAAAHWRLGREQEARAALAKGMALRPGATVENVALPTKNASPAFLDASSRVMRTLAEIGLPAGPIPDGGAAGQ